LVQRIGDDLSTSWILGGRTIEMSGDAVCGLHRAQEDDEREFLYLASKLRLTVSPNLAPKSVAIILVV
jgi:hypothetical protein